MVKLNILAQARRWRDTRRMDTAAKLERAERNAGSGKRDEWEVSRIEWKSVPFKVYATKVRDGVILDRTPQARPSGATCHHSDGDMHDCAYVEARNRLINEATQVARGRVLGMGEDVNGGKFSRAFMDAMTELWQQKRKG